jgi:hypothetical protein
MSDLLRDVRYCSFGGVVAAQRFCDFYLWEGLLNSHPEVQGGIVEVGTFNGGMSLFLSAQAEARGVPFDTYDIVEPERQIPGFTRLDVFEQIDHMRAVLEGEALFLLCDGGDKPRELREIAPLTEPGSIVVVHDWLTEVYPADVPDFLEEIHADFSEAIGSMSRVFRRKETP